MQITIPSYKIGGTLSQLAQKYGTTVAELMRLNPQIKDKNKIQEGATLNVPELAGTLKTGETGGGALEKGGGVNIGGEVDITKPKTLPEIPEDNLSIFKSLLKKVSERYGQEAMATRMQAGGKILGLEPSKISGGTLAGIVDFIKGQTTPGIADIYKETIDLLEDSRARAEKQITLITSQNAWGQMNDKQIAQLSSQSGMDFDVLMNIKKTQEEETKKPKSFQIVEEGGRKIRLGFDEMGKIINRIDIGEGEEAKRVDINQKLYGVGLPYTAVSDKGKINDSVLTNLSEAGIPPDTAQGIMDEILKGTSLEELRQYFRSKGVEMINGKPIMDIFMETIQGTKTGDEIVNLFKRK